tara:strand:+ start:1124 stop:2401 length:1278 start_codon:yes stop_codon:yes gene_type:complete
MPTQIQLRRDTAADWTSNNPTLAAGEFGWESDTNRFKIGTGSAAWNSLEYADTLKSLGDMTITGSTISAPSNGDLTLTTAGSGVVLVNDSFKIGSGESVTTILDEDNLSTNSATALATQQSIKAYVDNEISNVGIGDISAVGSTLIAPSNADLSLTTAGTGNVVINDVSIKDNKVEANRSNDDLVLKGSGTGKVNINEAYTLPNADGSANQFLKTDGAGSLSFGSMSVGDLSIIGSSILAPSNADLTLNSSNGNVVIEGIRVAGTTLSTEDSSPGIEIAGNLIPSQDGVFQLGSSSRRWQTLFVAAETIDLGGAVISSDTTGSLTISASGATLPSGSKVVDQAIVLGGKTNKTTARPVQIVKVFVSDGSTNKSDAQLLAGTANLELEFNGTVEDVPVYTEAQQTFTLSDGGTLAANAAGATLFQF